MEADYTVVFRLIQQEVDEGVCGLQNVEDLGETNEIMELARIAEAMQEPEPSCFMIG